MSDWKWWLYIYVWKWCLAIVVKERTTHVEILRVKP